METIGKLWAGRVYGTNTGNLFLEFDTTEGQLSGTLRVMDNLFGLTVYRVTGSFDGTLKLIGELRQAPQGVTAGSIEASAVLTPRGNLKGEWRSSIGTAGTFEAYPHGSASSEQGTDTADDVPEQIFTSAIPLGAVRLYAKDLWKLTQFIGRDFLKGRMVVTYAARGNEVAKYLEDFRKEAGALGELRQLRLTIQEPVAHGINKVVVVDLNSRGKNEIRVQGIDESWVIGKAESTARVLRAWERSLVTTYKKFGLTLNQTIFLAMLVLIPAIVSLWQRAVFVVVVVLLLAALFQLHSRFIPNSVLYLGEQEPTFVQRAWPSILSWVIAASASLAAGLLFYWLTHGFG